MFFIIHVSTFFYPDVVILDPNGTIRGTLCVDKMSFTMQMRLSTNYTLYIIIFHLKAVTCKMMCDDYVDEEDVHNVGSLISPLFFESGKGSSKDFISP